MKQVRREAEKNETIVITNSMSAHFGKTFTVSYCVNGYVYVSGPLSFAHSEYEILEEDVDEMVRHFEIDYQLKVLHYAIQHGDKDQIERSKCILSHLTR